MRTIFAITLLSCLLALAYCSQIRSLFSSILRNQPSEIQSALESEFSNLATFTATDSSAVSSVSSEINAALESFLSDITSIASSVESVITGTTSISNGASVATGNSVFAVLAGFIMTVVLFQAF